MADQGKPSRDVYAHSKLINEILATSGSRSDCIIWKNATGVGRSMAGNFIKFGKRGSSDLLGITSDGKMLCIEGKTGKATQSAVQKNFQKMIEKFGGRYIVAKSSQQVIDYLDALNLAKLDFYHDRLSDQKD